MDLPFKKQTDIYLGEFIGVYVAYANDNFLRHNASSGGVVTQLVVKLFENKVIDGAFLVRMDKEAPWKAEPYVAVTTKDILDSPQSKYQPVQVSSLLKKAEPGKKYVIVDKYCGLLSLDKLIKERRNDHEPTIIFKFGIFCGFEMSMDGTDFLLKKLRVKKDKIKELCYRWSDWPGGFYVTEKEGESQFLPKSEYSLLAYLCASEKCLFCQDQTNELADISFGDAWSREGGKGGFTVVVTRTENGETLMRKATEDGWITSQKIDYTELKKSHFFLCRYKKLGGALRANYFAGRPLLRNVDERLQPVKKREIIVQLMYFFIYKNRYFFLKVFQVLPLAVFRYLSKNIRSKFYRNVQNKQEEHFESQYHYSCLQRRRDYR